MALLIRSFLVSEVKNNFDKLDTKIYKMITAK